MRTDFIPRSNDDLRQEAYSSGILKEERWLHNGTPANGWSRKIFYESGKLELQECYSNGMVIEQLFYNEKGGQVTHKIYSHKQKKLIDKPKQEKVHRPNVVSGYSHMGFYFKHLPVISQFIGATYNEEELWKAYHDFMNSPMPDDNTETSDKFWGIRGKEMRFGLWFESGEGYYQWHLWTNSEAGYEKARLFMETLT